MNGSGYGWWHVNGSIGISGSSIYIGDSSSSYVQLDGSGNSTLSSASGNITFDNSGNCTINTSSSAFIINSISIFMPYLPTSDPGVTGKLWNNGGALYVSA